VRPILLEIVTRVITSFDHCRHCAVLFEESGLQGKFNQKTLDEYPQDVMEEYVQLSNLVRELARLYKHRLQIRIIDAQSMLGLYKSVRYRIRKYPTFIVNGKQTYAGWDKERLEGLLDQHIQAFIAFRKQHFASTH
jgi:hypothetical protein